MHADSPSKAFILNCIWSNSKAFALHIFLTIFSSCKATTLSFLAFGTSPIMILTIQPSPLLDGFQELVHHMHHLSLVLCTLWWNTCYEYAYTARTHAQFLTCCWISCSFSWDCRSCCWSSCSWSPFSDSYKTMSSKNQPHHALKSPLYSTQRCLCLSLTCCCSLCVYACIYFQ